MEMSNRNLGPFAYMATGIVFGTGVWYYDYWRRRAIEEIMYDEDNSRLHSIVHLN